MSNDTVCSIPSRISSHRRGEALRLSTTMKSPLPAAHNWQGAGKSAQSCASLHLLREIRHPGLHRHNTENARLSHTAQGCMPMATVFRSPGNALYGAAISMPLQSCLSSFVANIHKFIYIGIIFSNIFMPDAHFVSFLLYRRYKC